MYLLRGIKMHLNERLPESHPKRICSISQRCYDNLCIMLVSRMSILKKKMLELTSKMVKSVLQYLIKSRFDLGFGG